MSLVKTELRKRIRNNGVLTFAEFVDLALYWPHGGYYCSNQHPAGPGGDFYTSPTAHPAFGACLSFQLEQMWAVLGRPHPFFVVEFGAGDGRLCHDIMTYLARLQKDFLHSIQ